MKKIVWRRQLYKLEGDEEYSKKHIGRMGNKDVCYIIESAGSSSPTVDFLNKNGIKRVADGGDLFSIKQIKIEAEKWINKN